ncbi:hypothetical protein KAR48_06420 [bacterium]|nr:hypothetical protein [bacterium]
MSSRRNFFKIALQGLGSGLLVGCGQKSDDSRSKYDYDLANLKKVDPQWLKYSELRRINLSIAEPSAITTGSQDYIFVAGKHAVQKLDMQGTVVSKFAIEGQPRSIAVDTDDRVYLAFTAHIEVWNERGTQLARWDELDNKAILTGLAINEESCFAADAGNRLIHHYNLEGRYIGELGRKNADNDAPGFIIPSPYFDVSTGHYGELWATNTGRHFVENYATDGRRVSSWGKASYNIKGFSGCCNPTHLAVMKNGRFVTSEKGLPRVKVYGPSGELEAVVAGPNEFKENTTGLDLAVLQDGIIAVLVPEERQIRLYTPIAR